ncbi:DUF4145 domain-containing protein [Chromobacterium haemolyticum]|uniref:DUF4145 domain-containing protein n=1 Tax=Chromobacterium haemolyticum TaxID=394935 RepID=A0ABS3GND7_9NEIS|nr:DUF4145 domain-containing protein [Chromobacterium haemolyticum]MBK0415219.1 DUF4145 domain-containing protein [Chromobacterium haemolyticum]MBO0416566.1 DUF4145 domain-containing protein [Chromobacterium haemolyticum]MBO0499858.1 DUF4145 domain-containing protein [Chromobacterium haemolyticum]
MAYQLNLTGADALNLVRSIAIFPKPEAIEIPKNLPDNVSRAFIDSAKARKSRLFSPACASYRRTMELALKGFAPEIEAWKLEKRIDKLAAEHRITPALQEWAHQLRLDGNEAIHGDDEADEELCTQMHELTRFLLIYLYSLPAQIEQAKPAKTD